MHSVPIAASRALFGVCKAVLVSLVLAACAGPGRPDAQEPGNGELWPRDKKYLCLTQGKTVVERIYQWSVSCVSEKNETPTFLGTHLIWLGNSKQQAIQLRSKASSILIHPRNDRLIYAATKDGLYVIELGNSVTQLQVNLGQVSIMDIQILAWFQSSADGLTLLVLGKESNASEAALWSIEVHGRYGHAELSILNAIRTAQDFFRSYQTPRCARNEQNCLVFKNYGDIRQGGSVEARISVEPRRGDDTMRLISWDGGHVIDAIWVGPVPVDAMPSMDGITVLVLAQTSL